MPRPIYKFRAWIKSFVDRRDKQGNVIKYAIKRNEKGELVCTCPDTIYRHRECKHLEKIRMSEDKLLKLFLAGDKFDLDINGEKWEVISEPVTPEIKL